MSVLASTPPDKRTYMRADERRAHILEHARRVFATRGFHVTSVADICRAAGIGRGTLYQYFGNKREVFLEVVSQLADRVRSVVTRRRRVAELDGVEDAPPRLVIAFCERRLRELLEAVFVDEASLRLLLREARGLGGGIDEVIRRVDAAVLDALVSDLDSAHRIGVIDCPDPRRTALFLLGGIEKLCLDALEKDEPVDLESIVRVATRIELLGLLTSDIRAKETS